MADDKISASLKENTPAEQEVIFEVPNEAEEAQLISILQRQISMSKTSASTLLGYLLADEKLRKEFAEHNPNFYTEAFEKIKEEADAYTKCLANEPEIAEKAYRFANRGQLIALLVTIFGLIVSAYLAYAGAHASAGCVGVASLAPGLVSAFVNRDHTEEKQHPAPKTNLPQNTKGK